MKVFYKPYFILIVATFFCLMCCRQSPESLLMIQGDVESGSAWEYPLGNMALVGGGLSITKEPLNALQSDIRYDSLVKGLVYYYLPEDGFRGVEHITITRGAKFEDHYFEKLEISIELEVK